MNLYSENYKIRRIKTLIDKAQTRNGVIEAKNVLREAMTSIGHIVDGHITTPSQILALKFLHDSLKEYLINDVPLENAFCVDKSSGGQRVDIHGEDVFYILRIDDEISKQIRLTGETNIKVCLKRVANQLSDINGKVSAARLKLAWDRLGSLEGYKARNENPES